MFGYLNLNDPRDIGDKEAQEMVNCRVEKGYLEYNKFAPTKTPGRSIELGETGGTLYMEDAFPIQYGAIKYTKTGAATAYQFGIPSFSAGSITTGLAAGAAMPAGNYKYIFTLYNNSPVEESAIQQGPFTIAVTAGNHPSFSTIPTVTTNKTLAWKIYRMPVGGTEYLYVGSVANGTATFEDTVLDAALGSAYDLTLNALDSSDSSFRQVNCLVRHNNRIVIAGTTPKTIFFNASDSPFSVPLDHQLTSPGWVYAMFVLRESLVVLTNRGIATIYGTIPGIDGDISMKTLNEGLGDIYFLSNTYVLVNGIAYFPYVKTLTYTFTGGTTSGVEMVSGFFAFDGLNVVDITSNISSLFPRFGPWYFISPNYYLEGAKCEVFENRFFAFDVADCVMPPALVDIAAVEAWMTTNLYGKTNKQFCYDTKENGWFLCDSTTTFKWRSKEFGTAGKVQQMRTAYVVGSGTFTVEIFADGGTSAITTATYTLATKTRVRFNVAPYRANTFSFKFTGNSDAKIYEYGRIE